MASSMDEESLHQLYLWVDNIPLSRPKRNLSRDFSDGGVRSHVFPHVLSRMYLCKGSVCTPSFCWGMGGVRSVSWDFSYVFSVYIYV